MNKYDTFNPEIGSGQESEESLTYGDINESEPQSAASTTRRRPAASNMRRRSAVNASSKPKSTTRKLAVKKTPVKPSVPVGDRIREFLADGRTRAMFGIVAAFLGGYLLLAFISYISTGFHDQSEVQNLATGAAKHIENPAGEAGARLSEILINQSFGLASCVIILWLWGLALRWFGVLRFKVVNFTIKCLVALITTSLIIGLLTIALDSHFLWGGAHGYVVNERIIHYVGWTGAAMLCVLLVALFFVICLYDIYKYFRAVSDRRRAAREKVESEEREREILRRKVAELQVLVDEKENGQSGERQPDEAVEGRDVNFTGEEASLTEEQESAEETTEAEEYGADLMETDSEGEKPGPEVRVSEAAAETEMAEPLKLETAAGVMTVTANEIGKAVDDNGKPDVYDPTAELSHYKFPSYSLLHESQSRISVDQNEQLENQERIRTTLADFGIDITEIKATVGPTVTLYEIKPDKGIKISRIRSLGDDIALSLSAVGGVRIIAPIPGKGTVGIEVANKDPQTVSMRPIITSAAYQNTKYELPLAIGSTINNTVYIADLAKMPHLLVAGATGQGKSVGLNAIIASLLYSKHPAELKFVLVDPKMVEFSLYLALEKHYLAKIPDEEEAVITKPEKVVATLSSLCVEMDARYDLLKMAEVRNIKEYNAKFIAHRLNPTKGHRFMPYIVVVVDEFADLLMTAGKEVETPIARLAQKARAIGIHLILATQRPSANVITGVIKANFPARIAFKVASGVDSRTVLDATGAEHLIGRGDMLVSNNSVMERVQCAFIDTDEVTAICQHIKQQQGYSGAYLLPEPLSTGDTQSGRDTSADNGEIDPLLEEVARLVVTSNTASTTSIQRRFSIGFTRAGRIMDKLESLGVVGPATGGKPRQVLVDAATLEIILANLRSKKE